MSFFFQEIVGYIKRSKNEQFGNRKLSRRIEELTIGT